jgi:preprotein translocase subunit SecB
METDSKDPNKTNNEAGQQPIQGPVLTVLTQYIKDFSFENPKGAENLVNQGTAPTGTIKVDVRVKPFNQTDIEVALLLNAEAKINDNLIYVAELEYAGLFRIGQVPQDAVLPILMIEAPRLLFPFARNLIALTTQNGGFAPLFLNPIDFAALFRQKREEIARQQQQAQQTSPSEDGGGLLV